MRKQNRLREAALILKIYFLLPYLFWTARSRSKSSKKSGESVTKDDQSQGAKKPEKPAEVHAKGHGGHGHGSHSKAPIIAGIIIVLLVIWLLSEPFVIINWLFPGSIKEAKHIATSWPCCGTPDYTSAPATVSETKPVDCASIAHIPVSLPDGYEWTKAYDGHPGCKPELSLNNANEVLDIEYLDLNGHWLGEDTEQVVDGKVVNGVPADYSAFRFRRKIVQAEPVSSQTAAYMDSLEAKYPKEALTFELMFVPYGTKSSE